MNGTRQLVEKLCGYYNQQATEKYKDSLCEVLEKSWGSAEIPPILGHVIKIRHTLPTIASLFEAAREIGFKTKSEMGDKGAPKNPTPCPRCEDRGFVYMQNDQGRGAAAACDCMLGRHLKALPRTGVPMDSRELGAKGYWQVEKLPL